MKDYFTRAETIIGSTFLKWDELSDSGRKQAFYHIKKTSKFLENTSPEVFLSLTKKVQVWLEDNDQKVDSYLKKIDGYEIKQKRIYVYSKEENPIIPLLAAPDLLALIQGDKPYEFGDFIRMSYLIRDENYFYSHLALKEAIREKL